MASDKGGAREARLAAALKENLRRRKSQARAKAKADAVPATRALSTAPQAGVDDGPGSGLKTAPKRI